VKLEDEIKMNKPFPDEFRKAIVNVMYTGMVFSEKTREILKEFEINEQHYNILRILRGKNPGVTCPGEIKNVLINKRGDLTRLLDKLDKMNLIARQSNEINRRMVDISINDNGLKLLDRIVAKMEKLDQRKKVISQEEARELNRILDKLRDY